MKSISLAKETYLRGTEHIQHEQPNGDHYAYMHTDNIFCAVVCDGAGGLENGSRAAQIVSTKLCAYISDRFTDIRLMMPAHRRFNLAQNIDQILHAEVKHEGIETFGTTVMALAMDNVGHILAVHLGDGIIERKDIHGVVRPISPPENAMFSNATYLTGDESVYRRLRTYVFESQEPCTFILKTDGAINQSSDNIADDSTELRFRYCGSK